VPGITAGAPGLLVGVIAAVLVLAAAAAVWPASRAA
jgi:hypothetical protein